MNDFIIRTKNYSDLIPIIKIVKSSFPYWYRNVFYLLFHTIIIEKDKKIAGFVCVPQHKNFGEIGLIAVSPEARGQNLGSILIQKACEYLKSRRKNCCLAKVRVKNEAALNLFFKNNFSIIKKIERPLSGDVFVFQKILNRKTNEQQKEGWHKPLNIVLLTTAKQIYAPIVIEVLRKNPDNKIVAVFLRKNKNLIKMALKTIKKSGIKYSCLRFAEQIYLWFLSFLNKKFPNINRCCEKNNLPIFKISSVNSKETLTLTKILNTDVAISIYFDEIIKKDFLSIPSLGTVNIHRSLLPKYRGPNSLFHQLANQEEKTGVTIHIINGGVDTGDILIQKEFELKKDDSHHSACIKSAETASDLINTALERLKNGESVKQDALSATTLSFPTNEVVNKFIKNGRKMF